MTSPLLPYYPEERRLATVMFADVQGFTTLSENLDFEEVSDLIKEIWERVDSVIEAHGGYIDKHIGDGVMAVWGAPHAREDDAERAVTAALELQTALADYATHSAREGAHELKMRVGVNTGSVLAGYVGARGEYTVIGDTVNIASRLETTARPGTVVISESTYQLVRGLFKFHHLDPLLVKGKTEPLLAFLAEEKLVQPNRVRYRGAGGLETKMVEREAEMARLNELYQASRRSTSPTFVLVRGESGLGKSRLLLEFLSRLEVDEQALTLFSARALEQANRAPFFIWKTLWQSRFGFSDTDPRKAAREKFLRGVQSLWGARLGAASAVEAAHVIGSLIGLEWEDSPFIKRLGNDPETITQRAFELTRELFCRVCAASPTVLMMDDLHYADTGSLNLLLHLIQSEPQAASLSSDSLTLPSGSLTLPLMIVCGVRPGLLRSHHALTISAEVINLNPLPTTPEVVARAYPALRKIKKEILTQLAKRADGNPYYLEELVKSLIGSRLHADDETLADTLAHQLPDSLHALLQARLDSLSPEARWVALLASVVGRAFWVGAVLAEARQAGGTGMLNLSENKFEVAVTQGLSELVRAEIAFPRVDSLFSGDQEYIFKHSLLRDVAYELLPLKQRKNFHLSVARWLMTYTGSDFIATVAEHLEKAGTFGEAAQYYEQAAHYAQSRGALEEARWMQARAVDLRTKPVGTGMLVGKTG